VIYVYDGGYSPDKLQGRNEWIVDNVNLMLALWDGSKGGTYNCIQYCNKKNIPWVNLWDSWHENSGVFKNNNSIEEKVIIGNLKNLSPKLGYLDILADRSSPLGNPYELSREEDRELCTKAFDLWLKTNLKAYKYGELKNKKLDPKLILEENGWKFKIAQSFKYPTPSEIMAAIVKMMGMLDGGQKIRLLCHCDPKLCHTSIIKELLIDALNNLK
jgi:hypothetical protein